MADESWGQLLHDTQTKPPIRLMKSQIRIGRTSDCDVSFLSNKYISGHHCTLTHDEDGKVWLTDSSTNGTFVNGKKLKTNERLELKHNEKIQLVKKPNQPSEDIVLVYQDLKQLQEEECNMLDNTEEYNRTDSLTGTPELKDETDGSEESKKETEQSKVVLEHKDKAPLNAEEKPKDNIGETLVCGICQDIFHDCLSLQPCMHSFCSSCYSQWMERSKECPTCRIPVERMSRNHIVNNLVEAYLKEHPETKRSEKEIAEMDALNKITEDMIRPNKKRKIDEPVYVDDYNSDIFSDVSSDSTIESDEEEYGIVNMFSPLYGGPTFQPSSFGSLFGFSSTDSRALSSTCRWCPRPQTSSQTTSSPTTVAEIRPGVPQPVCPDRPFHLLCSCCLKLMPKQENLPPLPGGIPYAKSQKCVICERFFCHLLWKCDKADCLGCLNEFKDIKFSSNCLDGIIRNNKYESQILKNYLDEKGWTMEDLISKCLEQLDSKAYTTADLVMKPELNSKFILCYGCALRNFRELAFQFRRDIPRDELPAAVTSRPDCHWGKNCRTQTNPSNPHHASRYNHVCEQTRFR